MSETTPRFLVLGAGGLGCPALLGLSCVESPAPLTIVDADVVDATNLQRQVLYTMADVGSAKVEAARFRLRSRRPDLRVETVQRRLDGTALDELIAALPDGSVVLECTDDPALKFAANDLCLKHDVALVVAGVLGWRGQALAVRRGRACYRCLFEAPPPAELSPACSQVGVMGSAAGVVGQLMANLAIRMMSGEDVAGELFVTDLSQTTVRSLRPAPREGCLACAGEPTLDSEPRVCADIA